MGLFCKTELQALSKCFASAWEVHDNWFRTFCSHAISHDWSRTWHVDNDCRPSWAWLCCFTPFIIVIVKSHCRVNSALECSGCGFCGTLLWLTDKITYPAIHDWYGTRGELWDIKFLHTPTFICFINALRKKTKNAFCTFWPDVHRGVPQIRILFYHRIPRILWSKRFGE